MPKFSYSALRDSGERVAGVIEGHDRAAAISRLADLGLHPIDVKDAEEGLSARSFFTVGRGVSEREITIFTRELAWLLGAGMTLNTALELLSQEGFAPGLSAVVKGLRTEIRKGRSFREALAETGLFQPFYVSMVAAGEASATLPAVLNRLAEARDREHRIRSRVVSALIYPAVLVVLAAGALVFIMVSVVPNIKDMIMSSGAPVPDAAARVIAVSDWLIANGFTLAVAIPAVLLVLALLWETAAFRAILHRLVLALPLAGSLLRKAAIVRFCRVLGTLAGAGVSLPESLKLIRPTLGDRDIAAAVSGMETALRRGEDFVKPLERPGVFPPLLARMLKVGNETGNLTASLNQVTEIMEDELDRAVERSLTLLGPLIIVSLSGLVAFIIASLMSAIVSINDLAL